MRQRKIFARLRWKAPALLLGLLLAAAVPAAGAVTGRQGDAGVVRIVVNYRDAAGNRVRLAGVEVLLIEGTGAARHMGPIWHPGGNERYACTNANGVAVFHNVPAGAGLWALTGVGHPGVCTNAEYLNPSTGKKMLSVDWQKVYGGGQYVPFFIAPDEVRTIRMMARTPTEQDKICAGFYATWVGTPGDDVFVGTAAPDVVVAGEGNDQINGRGGWDVICAGPGEDVVHGGAKGDIIFGEEGRDILNGQTGVDWLFGGPDFDTCRNAEFVVGCERTP